MLRILQAKAVGAALTAVMIVAVGCDKKVAEDKFPDLHAVKGKVIVKGSPAGGGMLTIRPVVDSNEYSFNAVIGAGGDFEAFTVGRQSKKLGLPAGKYHFTYIPSGDQQTVSPLEYKPQVEVPLTGPLTIEFGK